VGIEADQLAPSSAWRRVLLRASLVHATEAELDWLIAEAGTVEGARRQAFGGPMVPMMGLMALNNFGVWYPLAGLRVAVLVVVGFGVLVAFAVRASARRLDPILHQRQVRTLKRKPSPDDPTLPADGRKRRRNVRLFRGAIVVYIPIIALGLASPWWHDSDDDPPFVPRIGIDEPLADVQVEGVQCILDASFHLNLTATLVNRTDLEYTVTLRADVRTIDNFYKGEQQVRVPPRSSSTRVDTFTGLTDPAERCELTVVKREQFPEARSGGSILDGDGRGVTVTPR